MNAMVMLADLFNDWEIPTDYTVLDVDNKPTRAVLVRCFRHSYGLMITYDPIQSLYNVNFSWYDGDEFSVVEHPHGEGWINRIKDIKEILCVYFKLEFKEEFYLKARRK
jgi:hypothetical protein